MQTEPTAEDIQEELEKPFISEKTVKFVFKDVYGMTDYYCKRIYKGIRKNFEAYLQKNDYANPGYRVVPKRFFESYLLDLGYQIDDVKKEVSRKLPKRKDKRNNANAD